MTKKDYELIAACLARFKRRYSYAVGEPHLEALRQNFAEQLKKDNPNFNVDKFLRAAQGEE